MNCSVFLVFLAVVLGVSAQLNSCLASSVAPPYVRAMVGNPTSSNLAVPGMQLQTAINLIWPTVMTITSPFFIDLYFGLSNGDHFNIKSCQTYESLFIATYCGLGTSSPVPYVAYIVSQTFLHDSVRHVYQILDTSGTLGSTQVGQESAPYITYQQPWYTEGAAMTLGTSGWTNIVTSRTTGLGVHCFVMPFSNTANGVTTTGVASWDRTPREYCDSCTQNSEAIPTAVLFANLNMEALCIGQTSMQGVITCFQAMLGAFKAGQRGRNNNLALGLDNGDYYELDSCAVSEYASVCVLAPTAGYIVTVNNKAIFGDNINRIYPMDPDGTVHPETDLHILAGDLTAYNPRVRPWYLTGTGISDPFLRVGASVYTAVSYGIAIQNPQAAYGIGLNNSYVVGVVSSTISTLEPCLGFLAPSC